MNKIICGLCKGRHEIPVDKYVFDGEIDPMDFDGMYDTAIEFVNYNCDVRVSMSYNAPNQLTYDDVEALVGDAIVVYVTGLTATLCALVSACQRYGVPVTAMHYNRESGEYEPQVILR